MSSPSCNCGHIIIIGDTSCRKCKNPIPKNISGTAKCVGNISSTVGHVGNYGSIRSNDIVKYLLCKSEVNGVHFFRIALLDWRDGKFECITTRHFSDVFDKIDYDCKDIYNIKSKDIITSEEFSIFKC